MTIVIDPEFSVYALVNRIRRSSSVIRHRHTMTQMSHTIENTIMLDGAQGRVFSCFQRMSRFLPQVERYKQLAANAEHVYVFGEADVIPPPIENTTYVYLNKNDTLFKEWFVVAWGPQIQSVLATRELTYIDDPDESRQFEGVWSFDYGMADIIQEWLTSAVDAHPLVFSEKETEEEKKLIAAGIERLFEKQRRESARPAIQQEIQNAVQLILKLHLEALEKNS